MGAVGLAFRAALVHRWRSWLALALLVSVTGGITVAAVAAGQRTATAYPRLLAATKASDLLVFTGSSVGLANLSQAAVAHLPGVASDARLDFFSFATATTKHDSFGYAYILGTSSESLAAKFPYKLVAGVEPDPKDPGQVLAGDNLTKYGIRVGSVVRVSFYGPSQESASNTGEPPSGPVLSLRVVGIEVSGGSLPAGRPGGAFFVTPAFVHSESPRILTSPVDAVRLSHGASGAPSFTAAADRLAGGSSKVSVQFLDSTTTEIEASIQPQVVGWWIVFAFAALAAMMAVGLALARQDAAEADAYPTLRALGMHPTQLLAVGLARSGMIGTVGAAGAVALAYALSPLAPVGEARLAEPTPGFAFDVPVLLLGALAVVVIAVFLGAGPGWRHAHAGTLNEETQWTRSPPAVVVWLGRIGASPSALIGSRYALKGGRGRDAVPSRTALLGATVGVATLVGAAVFGASLTHLVATPKLYGNGFSLAGTTGGEDESSLARSKLLTLPGIEQLSAGSVGDADVRGVEVPVLALDSWRGPPIVSVVAGHAPTSPHEVALGTITMREVHARIGSVIPIRGPNGKTALFTVVGRAAFPVSFGPTGDGGLGIGLAASFRGIKTAFCPAMGSTNGCLPTTAFFVTFAHSPAGVAGLAHAKAALNRVLSPLGLQTPFEPTSLINFGGQSINFPLIIGGVAVVFGVASLLHFLLVSVIRRRREIVTLKSIGFVRRQVTTVVEWQATMVAIMAVVVGTPIGIALGRFAWELFASNYGVIGVVVVPWWQTAAIVVGALAGATAIAFLPARYAARLRPSSVLRTG